MVTYSSTLSTIMQMGGTYTKVRDYLFMFGPRA